MPPDETDSFIPRRTSTGHGHRARRRSSSASSKTFARLPVEDEDDDYEEEDTIEREVHRGNESDNVRLLTINGDPKHSRTFSSGSASASEDDGMVPTTVVGDFGKHGRGGRPRRTYREAILVTMALFQGYAVLVAFQNKLAREIGITTDSDPRATEFHIAVSFLYVGNLLFRCVWSFFVLCVQYFIARAVPCVTSI